MGGERRPFFLLRGKKMIPVEVMSFPKVTELAGNRLFSWALETVGTHRKGMVLELARPPFTCFLCHLCIRLCICTVGLVFLSQGLLGEVFSRFNLCLITWAHAPLPPHEQCRAYPRLSVIFTSPYVPSF